MKTIISIMCLVMCVATRAKVQPLKARIGWQVPWAIQGQLVQIFKHTDILELKLNLSVKHLVQN